MPSQPTNHRTYGSVNEFVTALAGPKAHPITKILVANNGIGAVKLIRSVRQFSFGAFGTPSAITFVVMATPEDLKANAEYIRMADEIVDVPGGSNNNNYANVTLIVEIARFHRVDAVWAGWGHASENPLLPNTLHSLSPPIKFIGPPGPAMHALGDKIGSTIIAQTAGVPCISWNGDMVRGTYDKSTGSLSKELLDKCNVTTDQMAEEEAKRIGFPVMIKASEGGGGKGIRMVKTLDSVKNAFRQVQGEVPGSPIFIMKLSSQSRHLEVQLIADEYGDAIALNGRDCSVQRRHQKIIEEGPPVAADPSVWTEMEKAAVSLAKAVNYVNAGTVEYLYSEPDKKFYFLELNPRLQVEHPVTEMITRVNLPAIQVQIAMGLPLYAIGDIRSYFGKSRYEDPETPLKINFEETKRNKANGHCIAVRITAENAEQGFKPTSGGIQELNFRSTPDVWGYFSMDSSGTVHEFADSQFGHLFANGVDREQARKNMVLALQELSIRGDISTTIDYISNLMRLPDFVENRIDTGWLDRLISAGSLSSAIAAAPSAQKKHSPLLNVVFGASIVAFSSCLDSEKEFLESAEKGQIPPATLLNPIKKFELIFDGTKYLLTSVRSGLNNFAIYSTTSSNTYLSVNIRLLSDGGYLISVGGSSYVVYVLSKIGSPGGFKISVAGVNVAFTPDYDPETLATDVAGKLVKQLVPDGSHLNRGDAYAEIEVMKMFLPLTVPEPGTINWKSNEGAALAPGAVLAKMTLDNPNAVKQVDKFTGSIDLATAVPSSPVKSQSSSSSSSTSTARAHTILKQSVASLQRVMSGFVIPSDNLESALTGLQDAVSDPTLPVYEIDEQLSVLSGRIDSSVFEFCSTLLESYKVSLLTTQMHFPAHKIIDRLEEHSSTLLDGADRQAFNTLTAGLRDSAVPYVKTTDGNYGSERALQALLVLLRSFIDVERNFTISDSYADAIQTLRTLGTPSSDIMAMVRSHSQLSETSKLAELLIEVIGGAAVAKKMNNPNTSPKPGRKKSVVEGAHSLFAAMPCLSEIGKLKGNTTYTSLAAKARKLLLQETIPSVSGRTDLFAQTAKQAASAQPAEKAKIISKFVESNVPMTDIFLDSLSSCSDPILKSTLLQIYLEKSYRVYELSNFVFDEKLSICTFNFKLKNENATSALTMKKGQSLNSMNDLTKLVSENDGNASDSDTSDSGLSRAGRVPPATVRTGVFAIVSSISDLSTPDFSARMDKIVTKFPQFNKEQPRGLSGPINAMHIAVPNANVELDHDNVSKSLEQNLTKFAEKLTRADVRRLTFLLSRAPSSTSNQLYKMPSIFTYRSRSEFKEDKLFRHIEPAMAYNLDLAKVAGNFKVHPLDIETTGIAGNVHLYLAQPKPSALAKEHKQTSKLPRIFVRSLFLLPKYSQAAFERVYVTTLNALDSSAATASIGGSDNHIFINLLSSSIVDPGELSGMIKNVVKMHRARANLLGISEVEVKITCATRGASAPLTLRIVVANPTGFVETVSVYVEAEEDGVYVFRVVGGANVEFRGAGENSLDGQKVDAPYPLTRVFDRQRRLAAKMTDTVYCYDIPTLFNVAVEALWDDYIDVKSKGGFEIADAKPRVCTSVSELVVRKRRAKKDDEQRWTMADYLDGKLEIVETNRAAGENDISMVAWLVTLKTPEYPGGRQFILISNDITQAAGSFGTREDILFKLASEYARKRKLPRLYMAANSGARIGMAESVKSKFKVEFKNPEKPEGGFKHLYLENKDLDVLGDGAVITVDENGQKKITTVVGTEEDLGVENLKGSGLIAGETSKAYDEIFTLTVVLGRSVGIGAYLVRLGQRTIQKKSSSPIILTGYGALNKLMNSNVYSTNDQLGGPQIMSPNGVSHQLANDHLSAIAETLSWLSFVPDLRGNPAPVSDIRGIDVVERPIEFTPVAGVPYDPRDLLNGGYVEGKWLSGFFDRDSFNETMADWAKTVICGRARLGGMPVGVIATENRTVELVIPAEPADVKSSETLLAQAGGVWFPDSAHKTATAIRDFNGEDIPLMIFANWRGFSGGTRDMYNEILKFGSQIVDALVAYTKPVSVYLPPHGELRGGAWVVIDSTINASVMEFYSSETARGGVLEAAGAASIKFRKKDLIKSMHRLDKVLISLDMRLSERLSDEDREKCLGEVAERENMLLPVYDQISVQFADLHDTPGRMKAKGVIREEIPWATSRVFFYHRIRRRLEEFRVREEMCLVSNLGEESLTAVNASKLLKKWFVNEGAGSQTEEAWENDDRAVYAWFQDSKFELAKKVSKLRSESVGRAVRNLCALSEEGLMNGLRGWMDGLSRDDRDAFASDLSNMLDL
ncbi:hypothetical protein TrLO_g1502 [Triparma laevis f. longispina]|uniref:Acetyl-CoA carboxylase n=1 Tax=Triparma laevis f. longispina TaxID=1714387 RepID=A0A9W7A355_9STRA|nr:hypothetical protein TrLO_g1502 [Triparma laevis f. longispina]